MYKTRVLLRPLVLRTSRLTKLWLAAALVVAVAPLAVLLPAPPRWRWVTGWR